MTTHRPDPPAPPRAARPFSLPMVLAGSVLVILLGLAALRFIAAAGADVADRSAGGVAVDAEPATFRDEQGRLCRRPALRWFVEPEYPDTLRLLGVQGEVVVAITVDTTGAAIATSIHRGAVAALDSLAIAAARRTRWLPAAIDGVPAVATMALPYRFALVPAD